MDPQARLDHYCRRYGVGRAFGQRLLPLLQRAQRAPEDVRRRILELVEASFEKEASLQALKKQTRTRRGAKKEPVAATDEARRRDDERVLHTVAAMLHNWSPPEWTLRWGDRKESEPGPDGDPGSERREA